MPEDSLTPSLMKSGYQIHNLLRIHQMLSNSPLLKSAIQSGLSTRPSPGLDTEMGGEKETVLLLQSSS